MTPLRTAVLVTALGTGLLMPHGCSIDPPAEPATIESFAYSFGSFHGGYYDYELDRTGGRTHFTAHGGNGVDLDVDTVVDDAVWADLEKIVADHDLDDWDGHDESDMDVMDGYSFSLDYTRADGDEVTAHEYGIDMSPHGYDAAHEDLADFFETLVEES